jgi:thiol-disulfide isomerase/thioredoxin
MRTGLAVALLALAGGGPLQSRGKSREIPSFAGATSWLNSPPLTPDGLRGKVVLVDFWTFTCTNWLRTLPYVRGWAARYENHGLVVVGVHTPEFSIEKDLGEVRRSAMDFGIGYAVAVDNDHAVWRALENDYWPALYLFDARGNLRHRQFGEGGYEGTEQIVQQLLKETGDRDVPQGLTTVEVRALEQPADEVLSGRRRRTSGAIARSGSRLLAAPRVTRTEPGGSRRSLH